MASLEQLSTALVNADKAGDVSAARTLAREIQRMRGPASDIAPDPSEGGGTLQFGPWDTGIKTSQGVDRVLSGAGKAFADAGRGIKQLTGNMSRADVDEAKRLDAPLMATTTGKAGNLLGTAAIAAPAAFIPGVNTYLGASVLGGAMGALQPVGTDDSRLLNIGLGAAGGAAGKRIGDTLGALAPTRAPAAANAQAGVNVGGSASATPGVAATQTTLNGGATARGTGGGFTFGTVGADSSAGLNAAQRAAMQGGTALGMRTTPGQATGSRALMQMEAKLESQPFTSGPFNSIKDANQRVLNRATARAIGENSDTVDATVLARANDRLSAVFADVRDDAARPIDAQDFVTRLQGINDEFEGLLPGGRTIAAHPLVKRLFRYAEDGNATGRQLGDLTSKLGKAAHKEMTSGAGDREMGQAIYQIKDYVDDLVEQGLSADRLTAYQAARGQYRNLINLTKTTGIVNPSSGNVSGATLANTLQRSDKHGFLFGGNNTDMYSAARFAQAFKPIVGDSGTATRSTLPSPTDWVLSLPFNMATRAYTSSPAVNLAVGGRAAAHAAGRATAPAVNPLLQQAPRVLPIAGGLLGANAAQQ